jgi:hypothetical protein
MPFGGETYKLGVAGSWNANEDLTAIEAGQLAEQARNVNTHNGGAEKRGGTSIVQAALSGAPQCLGLGQMTNAAAASYLYFVGNDGKIYRDGNSVATGLSTTAFRTLTPYPGKMFIASGADPVKVDTGSAIATIATPAADWSGSNQPKQLIIHTRNASIRTLAIGVPDHPNTAYYSVSNSLEDFTGAGSGTVNVNVSDGNGIVAAIDIDENVLFLGREESFWFDDSSTTAANWGVYKTAWRGGAYSARLVIKIRNSVFAMMEDGDIYEVVRANELRDYDRASITRPWFIHRWIKDNVDLTKINNFFMAYDPQIDALKIFVTTVGNTQNTHALVYYLPNTAWPNGKWAPPHDCTDNPTASGYNASAGATVQVSTGVRRLYTGDYAGRVWDLEKTNKSDNSAAYTGTIDTIQADFERPRNNKLYMDLRLDYKSKGSYDIDITPIIDAEDQTVSTITLAASGAGVGSFVLDTDTLGATSISEGGANLGYEGRYIRLQASNRGAGEDFFLIYFLIDFVDHGASPF